MDQNQNQTWLQLGNLYAFFSEFFLKKYIPLKIIKVNDVT